MAAAIGSGNRRIVPDALRKLGAILLSQQVWCWGRDILRPEGNWLIETGFERIEAPADREGCSSVYRLELPAGRRVVLRGFGVFYGDDDLGGVFVPRYEFRPEYTATPRLERPPWLDSDLPPLAAPSESQAGACVALTAGLTEWIAGYESDVSQRLGVEYRDAALQGWRNGKRSVLPPEEMAPTWRAIAAAIAADPGPLTR